MGKCPFCSEEIKEGVLLCKHCKAILEDVPVSDLHENKFFVDNKTSAKKFELFILLFNIMVSSWSIATSQISIDFSSQTKTLFCLLSIASGGALIKLFYDLLPALSILCRGFTRFLWCFAVVVLVLIAIGRSISGIAVIAATNVLLIFIIWFMGRDQKKK